MLSRIVFAIFNPATLSSGTLIPFLYGLRFDFAAVCILNSLFILMHLTPGKLFVKRSWQTTCEILFISINSIALLFNYIDIAWYPFTQKRTTVDFFKLLAQGEDVGNNIGGYLADYWYLIILWVGSIGLGIFLYHRTRKPLPLELTSPPIFRIAGFIVFAGITFIGARGGLQYKPLSLQAAAAGGGPDAIPLVLNTPYTLLKSYGDDPLPSDLYMNTEEAEKYFSLHQTLQADSAFNNKNIVVIILESFSAEYIGNFNNGKGFTPFLDSLMQFSTVYTEAFANGKRSIDGIPCVTASIPNLMDEPFITSNWNSNRINSLASILKSKGYTSGFFHGGNNGTMGFDNFSKLAGFDKYYGRNEYDGPDTDYDGHWGIFDEPNYQFMIRTINNWKKPFTSTFFSLSSHHPYTIPAQYKGKFPSGSLPILQGVAYADFALQTFFHAASKQTWYSNTIFILTADHTGPAESEYYSGRIGIYHVPIVIFDPTSSKKNWITTTAQQTDIIPTALGLLNYSGPYSGFGQDLNAEPHTHWSVNYMNGSWQLITDNYLLQFDGNHTTGLYDRTVDSLLKNNLSDNLPDTVAHYEPLIKSILQQFRQGMIRNTLVKP